MKKAEPNLVTDEKTQRMIDGMIATEQRHMAERAAQTKAAEADCDCKEGMFPSITNRRGFLFAAGSTAIAAAAASGGAIAQDKSASQAPAGARHFDVPADPTKVQGEAIGVNGGYGLRSQFESETRVLYPNPTDYTSWSLTPLDKMLGNLTASGLHFVRDHNGTPTIDPAKHMLYVHGMVDKPLKLTMADIKRFPSVTRRHFIECSGNTLTEWTKPTMKTVQGTHGLLSTSEWTGVLFSTIAREVGLKEGSAWVLAEGADSAVMTRSIPMEKMLSDAMLAYGQNGEAIRPEQGYPLRLLLPGYEGNTQIKWLRRLEVSDKPFMTREETSKYTDLLPNGKARQFTLTMDAKSVITFPSGDMKLPGPGFYNVTGFAWSGHGRIQSVDVSTDGGKTWYPARIDSTPEPMCTVRFSYPWMWDGKNAVLQSRCTDETGYIQPTLHQLVALRGANSTYHLNAIQSWGIANDGSVTNVQV